MEKRNQNKLSSQHATDIMNKIMIGRIIKIVHIDNFEDKPWINVLIAESSMAFFYFY